MVSKLIRMLRGLHSFEQELHCAIMVEGHGWAGRHIILYTDNQLACQVLEISSKVSQLQSLAKEIFKLAIKISFVLVPWWQSQNWCRIQFFNDGSKFDDPHNSILNRTAFVGYNPGRK